MMNLANVVERNAFLYPDAEALIFADKRFSYRQLNAASNQIANGLRAMGIGQGDKVALSCPNLPYFPMIYYGILKTGAVVVPISILLQPTEISYHLKDCQAKAYFCFEGTEQLPMGQAGLQGFNEVDSCKEMIVITADPAAPSPFTGVKTLGMLMHGQAPVSTSALTASSDTAVILYTSGTTGHPKGAELSHSNLMTNAICCQLLMQMQRKDTALAVLPLFHIFAQTVLMNASMFAGSRVVLVPKFDLEVVFQAMQQHQVSIFAGVPTMYIGLLNYPGADKFDLDAIAANMRIGVSGGASLPVEVLRQFEAKFRISILEGYGLSETSPVATFNYIDADERIPGSVGYPLQGVEVRVMDESGQLLEPGQEGEVVVRGHNVMKGYYNKPEATAEAIRDGWFHTGDIGKQDAAGNLYIVDRLKDMIIRGGFNVYPREVEEVLMQHEAVAMAAVLGIPHATHGEEINAFVVLKPGHDSLSESELQAWSQERLARYKYPRVIEFRQQLPMTATGKIMKKALRLEQSA